MDIFTASLPWAQLGWGAIVVLTVLMIYRGYLVPKRFHEEIVEDRNRWRAMAEDLREENTKLLVIGELSVNSIYAIEKLATEQAKKQQAKKKDLP